MVVFRIDWMMAYQGMVVLAGNQVWWTWEVEDVFRKVKKGDKMGMKNYAKKMHKQISDLVQKVCRHFNNEKKRPKENTRSDCLQIVFRANSQRGVGIANRLFFKLSCASVSDRVLVRNHVKMYSAAGLFPRKSNSFSYERYCTRTRFETEVQIKVIQRWPIVFVDTPKDYGSKSTISCIFKPKIMNSFQFQEQRMGDCCPSAIKCNKSNCSRILFGCHL